jgi:DNA mismatch repair protein MutS2
MNQKTLKVLEFNKITDILASYAASETAKEEIRKIIPLTDIRKIEDMLELTDQGMIAIFKNGNAPIAPFSDIRYSLKKARIQSMLTLKEFIGIKNFLKIMWDVKRYFEEIDDSESIMPDLWQMISSMDALSGLRREIEKTVISEEEISDSASPELFRIRKDINRKNHQIREKLNSMISSPNYQKHLQENIITIRQERFVIPVKQEARGSVPGIVHDQSSSGATLFIEPMAIVELNNAIRTLRIEEVREIEKILLELTLTVGENEVSLAFDYDIMTRIDIVMAKSKYALELNATRPRLSDRKTINLKSCRHPLIPRQEVVASDIRLGEDFKILIVTGPNTGGKTVALKTTGLMCLMTQAGMFIPVKDNSEICVFQSIYADIGDEQSIEQSLSTFSSHMTNIVEIVDKADENSLVLFDELGAGTDPVEGAALAMSILDYLHKKNVYAVVTTHYSELKQYGISSDGMENASVEFDVNTLSPTYRLTIGIPGKSNAFEISKRLGLNQDIIDNAGKYLSEETIHFEDIIKEIQDNKKKVDEELERIESIKAENEKLLELTKNEKRLLDENKQQIKNEARMDAAQIILKAKEEAGEIIKEMQRIKSDSAKASFKNLESLRKNLKDKEDSLYEGMEKTNKSLKGKSAKKISPGDWVLIKSMNQKANVLSIADKDGNVMVEAGIMKLRVSQSDLMPIEVEDEKKSYSTKNISRKAAGIKSSIDVRGMTAEEAMLDVEKYLDDASLANLKVVTIVHGKGTGVLRNTIQQLLKKNKHVEEFRYGGYGEGGDGATIVNLK